MIVAKEIASVDVIKWWGRVEGLLKKATLTSRGKYTGPVMFKLLLDGKMQLWVAHEKEKVWAIAVTEIIQYPSGVKVFVVMCGTGHERMKWQHLMADLEIAAKKNGCSDMEIIARHGWKRVLNKQGYELTHVQLNKSLKE